MTKRNSPDDLTKIFEKGFGLDVLDEASKRKKRNNKVDFEFADLVPAYGVIHYLNRLSKRFLETENCVRDEAYFIGLLGWNVGMGYLAHKLVN